MKQTTTRLLGLILASAMTSTALAQWLGPAPKRLGVGLQQMAADAAATAVRGGVSATTNVVVTAEDAVAAATLLRSYGYTAVVLSDRLISATVPAAELDALLDLPGIIKVKAPRKLRPLLDNARADSKTDAVHRGTGFDSPYTGKGVLVGIIDQGFDYTHACFRDAMGKSRAKLVREYTSDTASNMSLLYSHTTSDAIIAQKHDGHDDTHATHVGGIAAGTRYNSTGTDLTPYYGMAYNADLALIASSFEDPEILEGVKVVKELAERNAQPWVVNMSFGSQDGPHDGTTDYDRALSSFVGRGGFVVAAMGNEGDRPLHLAHKFTSAGETIASSIEIEVDENGVPVQQSTYVTIWFDHGTNYNDLEVRARMVNYYDEPTSFVAAAENPTFWNNKVEVEVDSTTNNGKVNLLLAFKNKDLFRGRYKDADEYRIVIEFKAKRPGVGFHAWVPADYHQWFHADEPSLVSGDSKYIVAEGAASAEKVVAVAAYTTKTTWTTIKGHTAKNEKSGPLDSIATFSSIGPQVDNNLPKPTVAAPGNFIVSGINGTTPSFEAAAADEDLDMVQKLNLHGANHYYGVEHGTSMSSPVVTGAVALWLEAYPTMPYATLIDIFKRSSTRDSYTGTAEWSPTWGYGKLNVYEGLKLALEAKKNEATGIYHIANTATPITFLTEANRCRLLFGSNESQASIALYTTAGTRVSSQQLRNITMGQEAVVSLEGLAKGVYILRVKTAEASYVRKLTID